MFCIENNAHFYIQGMCQTTSSDLLQFQSKCTASKCFINIKIKNTTCWLHNVTTKVMSLLKPIPNTS